MIKDLDIKLVSRDTREVQERTDKLARKQLANIIRFQKMKNESMWSWNKRSGFFNN